MSEYKGNGLKDTIMRVWIKRREILVTDYSLVEYMLSPNPKIMHTVMSTRVLFMSTQQIILLRN